MNLLRTMTARVLSLDSLQDQRPFWPALFLCAGGLVMNLTLMLAHHPRTPFERGVIFCGLAVAFIGIVLTARFYILRHRHRPLPLTKAL